MTPAEILAIAAKHSAYADCTPTLRGDAIVAFAQELLTAAAPAEDEHAKPGAQSITR